MFTALSKPQNTKISSISVQIIVVNWCTWQSSCLYVTQEISNYIYNFKPHKISHYFQNGHSPYLPLRNTKLSTHFYRLQPRCILRYFEMEKTKYNGVCRLFVIWQVRKIHSWTRLTSEFKSHTCLLPHKFMRITCKKYRNASEIQFTK